MFLFQILQFLKDETGFASQRASADVEKLYGLVSLVTNPANHAQETHSNFRNLMKLRNFVADLSNDYCDLVYSLKFTPGTYGTSVVTAEGKDNTPMGFSDCLTLSFTSTFKPEYGGLSPSEPFVPNTVLEAITLVNQHCIGAAIHRCHLVSGMPGALVEYGGVGISVTADGIIQYIVIPQHSAELSEVVFDYFKDYLTGIRIQDLLQVERNILSGLALYETNKKAV